MVWLNRRQRSVAGFDVNALPAYFATGFLTKTEIAAIITAKLARKTVLARMFFQTPGSFFGRIYLSLNTGNGNKGHGDSPKPFVLVSDHKSSATRMNKL